VEGREGGREGGKEGWCLSLKPLVGFETKEIESLLATTTVKNLPLPPSLPPSLPTYLESLLLSEPQGQVITDLTVSAAWGGKGGEGGSRREGGREGG